MNLWTLLFAGLLGVVAVFVIPLSGWGLRGRLRIVGKIYCLLAVATLGRPTVTVGEHGDLTLKRAIYGGELPVDYLTLDGVRRTFSDPDGARHSLLGWPFAFADEVRGVLFDQRHADLGRRLKRRQANGDYEVQHVLLDETGAVQAVETYVRAFFEIDEGEQSPVNLSGVRNLVGGSEDSEMADRIDDDMEKAFADQNSRTPLMRLLLPITGGIGAWVLVWMVFTQVGSGGGGGGSTIRIGASGSAFLLLIGSRGLRDRLAGLVRRFWSAIWTRRRTIALTLGAGIWIGAIGLGLLLTLGPVGTALHLVAFLAGLVVLPIATFVIGMLSTSVAERASQLWMRLGLGCWEGPVIYLNRYHQQRIVEAKSLGLEPRDIEWWTLCKQPVAFDYAREADVWPDRHVEPADLEDYRSTQPQTIPDGGSPSSELPHGTELTSRIRRGGCYGFVPKQRETEHDTVYVRSGRATAPWADAQTGDVAWRAQQKAIQKYGGDTGGISDRLILLLTTGLFVVNMIVAAWVMF